MGAGGSCRRRIRMKKYCTVEILAWNPGRELFLHTFFFVVHVFTFLSSVAVLVYSVLFGVLLWPALRIALSDDRYNIDAATAENSC